MTCPKRFHVPWSSSREAIDDGARQPLSVRAETALPAVFSSVATAPLGRPAFAALQLFYSPDAAPTEAELQPLSAFAARVAHALRSGDHARAVEQELGRTRSLFEVVSEAVSRLSLGHTLETAVERTAELLAGRRDRDLPDRQRAAAACCGARGRGRSHGGRAECAPKRSSDRCAPGRRCRRRSAGASLLSRGCAPRFGAWGSRR